MGPLRATREQALLGGRAPPRSWGLGGLRLPSLSPPEEQRCALERMAPGWVASHECHRLTACWHGLPLPVAPTPSPLPPIRLEQQPEAGEKPAPLAHHVRALSLPSMTGVSEHS